MADASRELAALNDSAVGLRRKAAELQKAIDDVGGPPMKRLRGLVAQTQKASSS